MFESEKQRYKDCKVKSPNAYACKSDSSSKVKYLSIQRRNKLFVVGLFFFAFVFCLSAMFIAPNKTTPQTTTPTPVNAEVITGNCGPVGSESSVTYSYDSETKTLTISGTGPMKDWIYWDGFEYVESDEANPFADFVAEVEKIIIGSKVTSIGGGAFYGCGELMTSVTIPNNVTSIGCLAFAYCIGLTSITIPASVTSIVDYAFNGCSGLETITVDSNNTVYDSRNGCNAIIKTSSNTLIAGCKNTIIPNNVTSIGDSAFYGCIGLTSITIPASVTSIVDSAFRECSGLETITVDSNNTVYDSRNGCNAIIKTSSNTLIAGCKNTIIPNNVTSISDSAFYCCSSLMSVTIPNSVKSIGERAFYFCSSLTSIKIPDSVTSIGSYAFRECSGLTSIAISDSVTSIGRGAFESCKSLTSITVDSNNKIYDSRDNCNALIETSTNTLIRGCKNTIIPNNVTSIGGSAFDGCKSLTSIIIPSSVTKIDYSAFYGCSKLTSIEIPDSVTSIGSNALNGCSANLTIYGSGNENSAAYIYAQNNNINYVKGSAPVSCSVTIKFNANIEREFIVYVLGSDGNPTRQLIMQNGRTYVLDGIKYQEAFSILVAETLYSTCTFKDTATNTTETTRKKVFENGIDSNKSIEISISSASNSINNWVIL